MARPRLVPIRRAGLYDKHAPFWAGERAEHIVKRRAKLRRTLLARKRRLAARKRRQRRRSA